MGELMIAAGGSGDLVTAWTLARMRGERPVFAAPLWERTGLDPWPGPRGVTDVLGLLHDPAGARITARTRLPGGWSPLPHLVRTTEITLYLLDVTRGAAGVAGQLRRLAAARGISTVEVVDAGGDVLAHGDEPGLQSPALDAIVLAAVHASGLPARVTVTGAGLDGELTAAEMATAERDVGGPLAEDRLAAGAAAHAYRRLSWFPSEASLMTLLAAQAVTGTVDIRQGRPPVRLHERCARVASYDLGAVARRSVPARALRDTTAFADADRILTELGCVSEYALEVAARDRPVPPQRDLCGTDLETDASHLGVRRLARLLGRTSHHDQAQLDRWLAVHCGAAYRKPVVPVARLAQLSRGAPGATC
jgi:hypothetical protein